MQNLDSKGKFCREKERFSVEQIVAILKQAELGIPIAEPPMARDGLSSMDMMQQAT